MQVNRLLRGPLLMSLQRLKEIGPNPSSPKALGDLLMHWVSLTIHCLKQLFPLLFSFAALAASCNPAGVVAAAPKAYNSISTL